MRQIGAAIGTYADKNDGHYPPDLQTLARSGSLSMELFTCPGSDDDPGEEPADIAKPGHCSYVYVGAGLTKDSPRDTVVLLDDPANHAPKWGIVLYAKGDPEWERNDYLLCVLDELAAGNNWPDRRMDSTPPSPEETKQRYERDWAKRMPQLKSGVWRIPTTRPATVPAVEGGN